MLNGTDMLYHPRVSVGLVHSEVDLVVIVLEIVLETEVIVALG